MERSTILCQLNSYLKNGTANTKQIAFQRIKRNMQILSREIQADSSEMYTKIEPQFDEILKDVEDLIVLYSEIKPVADLSTNDKFKSKPGRYLPDKVFTARNSLITDLWENKHIGTIYHIFLAMFLGLFIHTIVHDSIHKKTMKLGLDLIIASFANIHKAIFVWICMFLTSFIAYYGLHFWAKVRGTSYYTKWNKFCCLLYVSYLFFYGYFFTNMMLRNKVTPAEAIGLLSEITRFLMKTHAYVRSSISNTIKHDKKMEFSKFLYFLFAPTLVYQDTYPRSKIIRWRYVMVCFAEVLVCILYISFLFERFLVPDFKHFGLVEFKWSNVILIILGNGIAGTLMLLCTFYALLHSWHNAFAEMLRFSDRLFYKDWWTSTSFARFYSTWNVIVHDWLYTYIYKDFYEILVPNKKFVAKFMVFLVSALFHEFILGFGFGFFFPILFILFFVFGLAVSFVHIKYEVIGNLGMWYCLSLGMGICMSTYCMEFYARMNCASDDTSIVSYFIPKSLFGCVLINDK